MGGGTISLAKISAAEERTITFDASHVATQTTGE